MRRYFDDPGVVDFFRNFDIRKKMDDKGKYIFIGIMIAVFVLAGIGVYWLIKKRLEDDYTEDWDDDEWEDDFAEDMEELFPEDKYDANDCSCSDKDVDNSVKVENI